MLAAHLTEEHLAFARVEPDEAGPRLAAWYLAEVPPEAVRTSPVHENVLDPDVLAPLVEAGRDAVSPSGGPLALTLPDAAVRMALIPMATLPRSQKELRELVAWRMKKALPYRFDEAAIATQPFLGREGSSRLLAIAVRRRILGEHERLFEQAGFEVGSVSVDSLGLAAQLPPTESTGDRLLLTVGSGWASFLVLHGDEPVFHRTKLLPASERRGSQRDWFVSGEVFPTLEYYRTKLGGAGIEEAWLHVEGSGGQALRETLESAGTLRLEPLPLPLPPATGAAATERLGPALALAARGVSGRLLPAATSSESAA